MEVLDGYTRVRSIASARWLWLAIDPVSKAILSLHIGGRTKDDALYGFSGSSPKTAYQHRGLSKPSDTISNDRLNEK
jgi:hypothetical protein